MNNKVIIEITAGHHFNKSVPEKGGNEYTLVDMNASSYGSYSPCSTEEEVMSAIKSCREWAKREGDRPVVDDQRIKQTGLMCYAK